MTRAMDDVSLQHCFMHPRREAVARCPSCKRFFCRECVTEHDEKVICASCLARLIDSSPRKQRRWRPLTTTLQGLLSLFLVWLVFYAIGQTLLRLPDSFHEGTLWKMELPTP